MTEEEQEWVGKNPHLVGKQYPLEAMSSRANFLRFVISNTCDMVEWEINNDRMQNEAKKI